jgi:hypothetical protein
MRSLLTLLFILYFAVPLQAEERSRWLFTGTTAADFGPARTYLDKETIKLYGNVVVFWAKHVPSEDVTLGGRKFDMFQKLYTADCITRLSSAVTHIGYFRDEPVETFDLGKQNKLIRPIPNSPFELLIKSACTIGKSEQS